jgi:uncharacterized protein YecE (DUF72 family)
VTAAVTAAVTAKVRIGIAGWSYEDWRGIVYPRACQDELRHCASYVDVIEINNTFYRFPEAAHCAGWVERVAGLAVIFTAKLPQEFTHQACADAAAAATLCAGLGPLRASGRLRALLAQFAHWFDRSPRNLGQLRWLCDAFAAVAPLVVELRHGSWATDEGLRDLEDLGVSVANLDYPRSSAGGGFHLHDTRLRGSSGLAYLRLHGRNAAAWFDPAAGRDATYDYEYPADEVAAITARAEELAGAAAEVVVIANNHFEGKAMKLALELKQRLGHARVPVPESMLQAYPALRDIAKGAQGQLF